MLVIERCHLDVEAMVAGAYASGLSTLADDEADVGAAVVDFGAGTTTLSVFGNGRFVHADGFALGGNHVTMDLARGLSIGLQSAERLKTLYGNVLPGGSNDRDLIALPEVRGEDAPASVPRGTLTQIIGPRIEEILEMVRDRLMTSPLAAELRGRVIPHRQGSLLTSLADLAGRILRRLVALGRPLRSRACPMAPRDRRLPPWPGSWSTPRPRISSISSRVTRGNTEPRRAATSPASDDGCGKASDAGRNSHTDTNAGRSRVRHATDHLSGN